VSRNRLEPEPRSSSPTSQRTPAASDWSRQTPTPILAAPREDWKLAVSNNVPDEATTRNTIPTMIAGGPDDEPIVLDEIIDAALPLETHRMLSHAGLSLRDVLAGNVPDLDPIEIITEVWERMLEDDEFEGCMRLLPDLLAEYENPVE
jgi:hypothetical protein